jgi:hypothetical protein
MNPSSRETSGISLPPPVAEQQPGQSDGAAGPSGPESQAAAPEVAPATGVAQPATSLPAAQPATMLSAMPADSGSNIASAQSNGGGSAAATITDDNDKVEKEWVDKVRRIIEQTKYDPYRQSEELTVVKADYMKQRYNKIIKVEK